MYKELKEEITMIEENRPIIRPVKSNKMRRRITRMSIGVVVGGAMLAMSGTAKNLLREIRYRHRVKQANRV